MNSVSYLFTNTICSKTYPVDHLILVSAGHGARSPIVVVLLFFAGVLHFGCLLNCFSSLLLLQYVFTYKSSYDISNTIVVTCRTLPLSPSKPSDTALEPHQEEFGTAIWLPWYLARHI